MARSRRPQRRSLGLMKALGIVVATTSLLAAAAAAQGMMQQPGAGAAGAAGAGAAAKTQQTPDWRASFAFPQCISTTLSYDVSFVGPLQRVDVGSVRYAYHRFGPLGPKKAAQIVAEKSPSPRANPNPYAPVVFIPGFGSSMYMWPVPLLTAVAEEREVIIFDSMRTGLSVDSDPRDPLTIPLMANSTMAMVTKLGLKTPDVWAWGLGGSVAYALLAYHHGKVGNAIIAAATPGGPSAIVPPPEVLAQLQRVRNNYTALLPFLFPKGAADPGVCGYFAAYNSFFSSRYTSLPRGPLAGDAVIEEQWAALTRFYKNTAVANLLAGVTNRVLIMHGVQDRMVPIRNAALADDLLLGSWMLQLPMEGHALMFSHTQATIYMTREFLGFANRLTEAEHNAWFRYGETAAEFLAQQQTQQVGFTPQQAAAAAAAGVPLTSNLANVG